jgi:hypothetical protein
MRNLVEMAVYVDDMHKIEMGRLHAMAETIGVSRRWFQGDHYDISKTKKDLAVKHGATEISLRCFAKMSSVRRRNPNVPLCTPEAADELFSAMQTERRKPIRIIAS